MGYAAIETHRDGDLLAFTGLDQLFKMSLACIDRRKLGKALSGVSHTYCEPSLRQRRQLFG
jgi:hypothetical protein